MASLIGIAVKGVSAGIGLASESTKARKEKKRAKKAGETSTSDGDVSSEPEDRGLDSKNVEKDADEEQWELDEAQEENADSSESKPERTRDVSQLIVNFINKYPPPTYSNGQAPSAGLPFPVVLPQRRPKDRSRGFVRAYAPVLEDCGIDQKMFLDFLETFDESSQASTWINAINLASFAGLMLPEGISVAVSAAVTIATRIAIEVQSRHRTNSFMDKINDQFFRPRGLYSLLLTWNPKSTDSQTSVDLGATITSSISGPGSGLGQKAKHNFRSSDGKTYGELEFPETAPLIFPGLDLLASQEGEEVTGKRDKLKMKGKFVDEYFDRRAQAKFISKNPDSTLAQVPKPTFTSRYADPNHPASSGNLISLVTGGHINPPTIDRGQGGGGRGGRGGFGGRGRGNPRGRGGRFGGERGRGGDFRESEGGSEGAGAGRGPRGRGGAGAAHAGPIGGIKKILKSNVIYLMIVNMPTDEEMADPAVTAAVAELA